MKRGRRQPTTDQYPLPVPEKPESKQKQKGRPVKDRPIPHGTYAAYVAGCHCPACKGANTEYQRERRGSKPYEKVEHGTRSMYTRWRCRCEACTIANREYQKVYMADYREKKWIQEQLIRERGPESSR